MWTDHVTLIETRSANFIRASGQVPRQQAGHMTAPDRSGNQVNFFLQRRGRPHMTHCDGLSRFPARSVSRHDAGASQAPRDAVRKPRKAALRVVFRASSGRRKPLDDGSPSPARPLLPRKCETRSQWVTINASWYFRAAGGRRRRRRPGKWPGELPSERRGGVPGRRRSPHFLLTLVMAKNRFFQCAIRKSC